MRQEKVGVGDREAGRDEWMGNKENELTSNARFTYMDLRLPVVSPIQYFVAGEGNDIRHCIMSDKRAE